MDNPLDIEIAARIRLFLFFCERFIRDMEPPGQHARLLFVLHRKKKCFAKELVAETGMNKANISRALAKMASLGLIENERQGGDRRFREVTLTPKGIDKAARTLSKSNKHILTAIGKYSGKQKEELFQLMQSLMKLMAS